MAMVLEPIPLPLTIDEHGVVRVTGTRVPIDFIVYDYRNGATAEDIAEHYPTLKLSDVHAVLSYYLEHRQAVDAYVAEQERLANAKRHEVERAYPHQGLRERLLARLQNPPPDSSR
ncbi:MAG: DUF433 domain-containing protein [Truepera sp.]|nr:DUF433 domain-containing protein [Truepera sp.]